MINLFITHLLFVAEGSAPVHLVDEMTTEEASRTVLSLPSSLSVLVLPYVDPCIRPSPSIPSIFFLSSHNNISLALDNIITSILTLNLSGPSMGGSVFPSSAILNPNEPD